MTFPFDAVLVLSYGGPRQPEDVLPFMRNATRGRGIPDERLLEVSEHYLMFGGASPINERNDELMDALRAELSPRHVPDRVEVVPTIPRTLSGKKLEVPVKRILTGTPVEQAVSPDALADPSSLAPFAAMAADGAAGAAPHGGEPSLSDK